MPRRFRLVEDGAGRIDEDALLAAAGALDAAGHDGAHAIRAELGLGPKFTCSLCHFAGVLEDEKDAHAAMHREGGHEGTTFTPSAA